MMTNTLDDGYRLAAQGKSPEPSTARAPRAPRYAWLPLVLLLGLATGTAAAQVRDRAAESAGTHSGLVAAVQDRTEQSDVLDAELQQLRAEVAALQDAALGANGQGRRLSERLAALELAAATVPVTGPGLVLTLDDAPVPDTAEAPAVVPEGRVLDRDLQEAVNGLWVAGAEAVAVNGLRLSTLTAIRSAGEAILVDFRPLSPPYRLEAIGDPDALRERFEAGAARAVLAELNARYGIAVSLEDEDELTLAGSGVPELRAVRP